MVKAKGKRGSWFAVVGGEYLPCVHEEWYHWNNGKPYYLDEGIKLGIRQWDELVDALKNKKRAILTKDRWSENRNFERIGYIAVWEIDNILAVNNELRFDFIRRISDLK
ncbi:MAG: hypothetical protein SFX19_09735 [Alphaproteobacteria bacterium]|nr:hypothetical protein [Alphaproteobacteria bacterium]